MSLNINPLLLDLQTFIESGAATLKVYREEDVPEGADTANGYYAWNFEVDEIEKCSGKYTNHVYGELEILIYARARSVRSTMIDAMLDLFCPETTGNRDDFSPSTLTTSYMHYCTLTDMSELFAEKSGHGTPDVPGNSFTFNLKASL